MPNSITTNPEEVDEIFIKKMGDILDGNTTNVGNLIAKFLNKYHDYIFVQ